VIPNDLTPVVLQGHVLQALRAMPDDSVQCVVTSPPYWGLRAYGTEPQIWGGNPNHPHEWAQTSPRRPRSIQDVRNPESIQAGNQGALYDARGGDACACGAWRGELGLEPTPELFVDHLASVFDEVRRVLRRDGTLWLDLGDTYATHPSGLTGEKRWMASTLGSRDFTGHEQAGQMDKRAPGLKPKDMAGIPWRVAFELQRRGWWLRADCVWAKPNPMPESVVDRPTRSHEYVFLLTKSERYFYDADAVRGPIATSTAKRAKNHYSNPIDNPNPDSKWVKNDWKSYPVIGRRIAKQDALGNRRYSGFNERYTRSEGTRLFANLKSVWSIPTQPYPEAHFATFPEAIPDLCIRAGTSERGACAKCGTPYYRAIRAEGGAIGVKCPNDDGKALKEGKQSQVGAGAIPGWSFETYRRIDLGFRARCKCGILETVPCLVLDPFAGSGTVLAVARSLGRRSVGVELNPDYVALARRRSSATVPDLSRFAEVSA
jgi:DNA modification methylase